MSKAKQIIKVTFETLMKYGLKQSVDSALVPEIQDALEQAISEIVGRWIPVSDGLPELIRGFSEMCFIVIGDDVFEGGLSVNGWFVYGDTIVANQKSVTHWQYKIVPPLPPLPEE